MPAQLVIFDFDGVLADSESIAPEAAPDDREPRGITLGSSAARGC